MLSLRLVNDFSCSELWLKHFITTNSTFPSGSLATSDDCFDIERPISLFCGLLQRQLGNVNEFTEICIRKNCAATPSADYSKQLLYRTSRIMSCDTCIAIILLRERSVKSGNLKQKYLHTRIAYYSNSTATGQILLLCGDVELNPGWQGDTDHPRANSWKSRSLNSSATNDSCGYIFNHRQIPVRITTHRDPRTMKQQSIRNNRNLAVVPRAPLVPEFKPCKAIEFCLLNARSIKNKATVLNDFVVENKIDVMAFTETWLLPGETDGAVISDITPTGYVFRRVSRVKRGGGVAVL